MSWRSIVIGCLIFATLVIPIVQLSFGFQYIGQTNQCPIQHDIMLLMAIGGVFEVIFFAAAFGFVCAVTPSKYKQQKSKSTTKDNTKKGSNRASLILIGFITAIIGACAIIFFVLIQIRVYGNFRTAQSNDSGLPTYCLFTIYSSAFVRSSSASNISLSIKYRRPLREQSQNQLIGIEFVSTMTTNYFQREPMRFQRSPQVVPIDNYNLTDEQIKTRQQMAHVNLVVTQAGRNVWDFEHPWSSKLCSCCADTSQCCFAFCCSWCFECRLFKRAGESMWTSLNPCAKFALRSKVRTAFRIEGDLCEDCCASTFCPCCAAIQLERELIYQGL
ncbi:unnamed protein product [Rotaria sordida]|uniref:Uncharacterized protein n=1 Tax=Rotaria sordida TaxID=392033 RepID=A0A818RI51_9BILA|nr:unnamed protein product [Rotaria sordida]CAF3657461.1 unnamed protein product [Rotaria sordida]